MIITVIGGPDIGKSSLIARILIETGCISETDIQKETSNMPKQWLPNLVDSNSEEKEQGITIQSSLESFTYKERSYILINNPGHESLFNEMIKNSSKSDIGMLVISAKPNELNKSIKQGLEHSLAIRVNGIKTLIICINKSEFINSTTNSFKMIVHQINESIKKLKFEKLIFCPVSAKLNLNIIKNDSKLINYSLLDIIENIKIPKRETQCIKPIENTVKAKLIFHKIPKVITKGFICVMHSLDKTYSVEFDCIKNGNSNFITTSNMKDKITDCSLNILTSDFSYFLDINCLLRKNDMTIAYGILY